jgi:predicted RNase H-like HicB family nuclease
MSKETLTAMSPVPFRVYLESGEHDVVWWAESDDLPGLSVAAPTLMRLRTLISEAAERHVGVGAEVDLELVGEPVEDEQPSMVAVNLPSLPVGAEVRKILITVG